MITRSNAFEVFGGDTLQMLKTRESLEALGVHVEMVLSHELHDGSWSCDLVHLFNIQTATESAIAAQETIRRGLPFVLSPIYWDPLPLWFSRSAQLAPVWRLVRSALGPRLGYRTFAGWQRLRHPAQETWRLQRRILLAAQAIMPNSRAELLQLCRDFRLPDRAVSNMAVVYSGVDARAFGSTPEPDPALSRRLGDGPVVLEVARVAPEKNQLGLIEALWDVDIPLLFVGPRSLPAADYVELCLRRAMERGRVHFVEWIEHQALPAVYALAAVHVLPSWRETPGLATLEAAALGCRVVSTSIGSAREYLGNKAWYCNPDDVQSIRDATLSALQAPADTTLRSMVLDRFTWEAAARATLEVYRRVLGAGISASV